MNPYSARPIRFHGLVTHEGWALKRYTITLVSAEAEPESDDWLEFTRGRALAFAELPVPARTDVRPGVGFVIEHRGAGADYVVLGWWDRENELPVRIKVRDQQVDSLWRAAGPSESFCVWDLQVIAFERDLYVSTMLARGANDTARDRYLAAALTVLAGDVTDLTSRTS